MEDVISKKTFLRRYKKNQILIARLEEKKAVLDEKIVKIKSPKYSDTPRGGVPVSLEDLISDKLELEDRITRLKTKGRGLKVEILDKIDELEDPRYAEVLELFFIECMSFIDIAEETGYTVRHIERLYREAIDSMSV